MKLYLSYREDGLKMLKFQMIVDTPTDLRHPSIANSRFGTVAGENLQSRSIQIANPAYQTRQCHGKQSGYISESDGTISQKYWTVC